MKFKDKERIFEDEASRVKRNKNLQWPAKFGTYKLVENRCYVFSIYDQENKAELVLESSKALSGLTFEVNWLDATLIDVLCRNERYGMTYGVRIAIPCPESRKFAIGAMTNLGKVIAHLDDFSIYYIEHAGSDGQIKYGCHHWHSVFAAEAKPRESVVQQFFFIRATANELRVLGRWGLDLLPTANQVLSKTRRSHCQFGQISLAQD